MPPKDYIKTDVKVFLDGKEVTNFFIDEIQIIRTDEAQSGEVLKLYDSFSGSITLSRKQVKRLIRIMQKAQLKNEIRILKVNFQNLFRIVVGLFKIWK